MNEVKRCFVQGRVYDCCLPYAWMRWREVWWMCHNMSLPTGSALSAIVVDVWDSNLRRGQSWLATPKQGSKLMILTETAAYIGPTLSPGWRTPGTSSQSECRIHYRSIWFLCAGVELRVQIKGKSLAGICSWCSARAAVGRNLVESSVPVLIDIGRCQYRNFPNFPVLRSWKLN